MTDLVLHHYAFSPFAEKARMVLAHKKLPWRSVNIPAVMPKPDVLALTGGYRRTPFLQIGADVYCDTALICDLLEELHPEPTLFPEGSEGLARALAQWSDGTLFWTTMTFAFQPAGVAAIFEGAPPGHAQAFAEDRARMRIGAPRLPVAVATVQLRNALGWLETQLQGRSYLLGTKTPSLADFAVQHPMWFLRRIEPLAKAFGATPSVLAWLERMAAVKEGAPAFEKMSSGAAIELAASSEPQPIEPAPAVDLFKAKLGQRVTVTPIDYAFDPVEGELLQASASRVSLRRTDSRAGTVHVHFPRNGFEIKPIAP